MGRRRAIRHSAAIVSATRRLPGDFTKPWMRIAYRMGSARSLTGIDRKLGRFFRDDEEMGPAKVFRSALEGAFDDAENLIIICSPAAIRSKRVGDEVRPLLVPQRGIHHADHHNF